MRSWPAHPTPADSRSGIVRAPCPIACRPKREKLFALRFMFSEFQAPRSMSQYKARTRGAVPPAAPAAHPACRALGGPCAAQPAAACGAGLRRLAGNHPARPCCLPTPGQAKEHTMKLAADQALYE